jgi:putative copper export protein
MTLEAGLVFSRFIHFTCAIILFGSTFFAVYAPRFDCRSERVMRPLAAVLLAAALCALLSSLAWFLFTVANMSGTLAGAFDGDIWYSLLSFASTDPLYFCLRPNPNIPASFL